jgi:thioredoxin
MSEKLTSNRFKEEIFDYEKEKSWNYKGELPAVIDFYADWCFPCRMLAPSLEKLAKKYEGKLKVYKVNTDEEAELAGLFGIRSIPTLLFIPKEGQPQISVGALPPEQLEQAVLSILLSPRRPSSR